jgi:hypothetical protein
MAPWHAAAILDSLLPDIEQHSWRSLHPLLAKESCYEGKIGSVTDVGSPIPAVTGCDWHGYRATVSVARSGSANGGHGGSF